MADEAQTLIPMFDEFGAILPGRLPAVEPELDPPLLVQEPDGPISALVVSSPHSGRIYPARLVAATKLSALALRRSEDAFVDELFAGCAQAGAPMIKALFPRAYIDVNREPYELDPRMFDGRLPPFVNTRSIRVAGGLGTIARVVGEAQEIYSGQLRVEDALQRIEGLYKPYHRTLRELVARARHAHSVAVLVDCHSMPSAGAGGRIGERGKSDIVLGDRYGASCDPVLVSCVERSLRRMGYGVQRNKPYAGGFITEYFGNTARACEALQIEVNRGLYLNERTLEKTSQFDQVSADMTTMLVELEACAASLIETRSPRATARAAAE